MKTKETKAERIFSATRFVCKRYIEEHGYKVETDGSVVGFAGLCCQDADIIHARTVNAVEKILAKKRRTLEIERELGVSEPERLEAERQTLDMVEATLNNSRKSVERFNEMLNRR